MYLNTKIQVGKTLQVARYTRLKFKRLQAEYTNRF